MHNKKNIIEMIKLKIEWLNPQKFLHFKTNIGITFYSLSLYVFLLIDAEVRDETPDMFFILVKLGSESAHHTPSTRNRHMLRLWRLASSNDNYGIVSSLSYNSSRLSYIYNVGICCLSVIRSNFNLDLNFNFFLL